MRVGRVAKEYTEWSVLDNDIDFKAVAGGTKELLLIRSHSGALGTVRDRLCLYIDCGYKSRLPNQNFVFVTALFEPRNHWVLCACNPYRCHGGCWYTPGHRLMGFLRSTVSGKPSRGNQGWRWPRRACHLGSETICYGILCYSKRQKGWKGEGKQEEDTHLEMYQ